MPRRSPSSARLLPLIRQLLSDGKWHLLPEIAEAAADVVPPERAVRRYSMSNANPTVELHYQVARGRRMVIYDALRSRARDEFETRGGSARDSGSQEWRLRADATRVVDSFRKQIADRLADKEWHPLHEFVTLLYEQISDDAKHRQVERHFGKSLAHVPRAMVRWERTRFVAQEALLDIGVEVRGRRNAFDREYRLKPGAGRPSQAKMGRE